MSADQQHITRLLERCKKGDQNAQFELYKRYYKAMFNTALRIVQDSHEAEDVMQEAFMKAFTKLDTFKGEVPFGAWLKRIVINHSLSFIKKKSRRQEVQLEVADHNPVLAEEGGGLDLDYSNVKVQAVTKAMGQLRDNYRTILSLSLIEGYDNEEIAHILDISNENCRTTISRAKSRLRKILSEATVVN